MTRLVASAIAMLSAFGAAYSQDDGKGCLRYLALGDSYTVGEGVPIHESFPYQTVQVLRSNGLAVCAPEIVAKTGWTTDELKEGMEGTRFLDGGYDMVTLLIGVNNQYRERTTETYGTEFEGLLKDAVSMARGRRDRVFVLSIPDWGVTPFAEGRDRRRIAAEIDAYNSVCRSVAGRHGVAFLDITPGTRQAGNDPSLLAADRLHPSGKEYARWSERLAERMSGVR